MGGSYTVLFTRDLRTSKNLTCLGIHFTIVLVSGLTSNHSRKFLGLQEATNLYVKRSQRYVYIFRCLRLKYRLIFLRVLKVFDESLGE